MGWFRVIKSESGRGKWDRKEEREKASYEEKREARHEKRKKKEKGSKTISLDAKVRGAMRVKLLTVGAGSQSDGDLPFSGLRKSFPLASTSGERGRRGDSARERATPFVLRDVAWTGRETPRD